MKKFFRILLWTLVAAVFIGTFVYLYLNSKQKDIVYELVNPSTETIERTTVLTGKIEPRDEIEIKPQISGIINEVMVEAGDHVNAGDIIAKIKVIPEENQLSSAENRVKIAQISLEEAQKHTSAQRLFTTRNLRAVKNTNLMKLHGAGRKRSLPRLKTSLQSCATESRQAMPKVPTPLFVQP